MTLDQVGMNAGPNLALLRQIKAKNNSKQIYAAGGVRGVDDLQQLADLGVEGCLIASALHDGKISQRQLLEFK
jgi:phosphoribosylformimino-5-aminoimidazole carboxamide ribotide isomerase